MSVCGCLCVCVHIFMYAMSLKATWLFFYLGCGFVSFGLLCERIASSWLWSAVDRSHVDGGRTRPCRFWPWQKFCLNTQSEIFIQKVKSVRSSSHQSVQYYSKNIRQTRLNSTSTSIKSILTDICYPHIHPRGKRSLLTKWSMEAKHTIAHEARTHQGYFSR